MGYTSNHTYHVLPAGVFNKCICIIAWCHVVSVYCSIEILSCKSIMSVGIFGVLYLIAKIAMIRGVSSVPKTFLWKAFGPILFSVIPILVSSVIQPYAHPGPRAYPRPLQGELPRCRPLHRNSAHWCRYVHLHPVDSDLARDRHYCAGYVPHGYYVPFFPMLDTCSHSNHQWMKWLQVNDGTYFLYQTMVVISHVQFLF